MSREIEFSKLQKEFIKECHDDPLKDHRWNGKIGATRSGKTTLDFMFVIPARIDCRRNLKGLTAITGVSLGTIGRNILEPMREFWNSIGIKGVISETKVDREGNRYVYIFGEKVYLLGCEKVNAVKKIRGAEFKYLYCDELAECNEEAFSLLKSRLSLPYSCCDFTCNPASDNHWLYAFIHSDIDIYLQNYTIFDNPFLSKSFVDNLCKEYAGTVMYDRYILGLWKKAEGLVYRKFADSPSSFIVHEIPKMMKINIGIDFGGNGSWHTFTATGFGFKYQFAIHLESEKIEGAITPDELERQFVNFIQKVVEKYKTYLPPGTCAFNVYCDSAEQVLIRGLKTSALRSNIPVNIKNALKMEIRQRIALQTRMFGLGMLLFLFTNTNAINAYSKAVYDSKEGHSDERLDDSQTNKDGTIDILDSCEYSLEPEYKNIINALEGGLRNA